MIQVKPNHTPGLIVVLVALGLTLPGCAAAPIQAMSDARQAIEAAAQSGGDQQAAQQMQEARAALAQAQLSLKNAQYRRARELAQQARAKAIEAQRASQP